MNSSAAKHRLDIFLNGRALATEARSLSELIADQALAGRKIATALNGHFVPEADRASTLLRLGDRVEIVSPRQGG